LADIVAYGCLTDLAFEQSEDPAHVKRRLFLPYSSLTVLTL